MGSDEQLTDTTDPTLALTADFSHTARVLLSAGNVEDTLATVAGLAVATIEDCDFAGLFLIVGEVIHTAAPTDPIVANIDALQQRHGQGPCLDAITQRVTVYTGDLGQDTRWPHFGPDAAASGVRSVLSLPLFGNGALGALNLYARYPQAFGVIDRARGLLLAGLAAMALSSAQSHDDAEHRAANLHDALDTREVIGQAQGILMEREHITADQAFDILRRASQHLNIKLRDVAQSLVHTGENPTTAGPTAGNQKPTTPSPPHHASPHRKPIAPTNPSTKASEGQ